jgi:hypothetical protein
MVNLNPKVINMGGGEGVGGREREKEKENNHLIWTLEK